MAPFPWSWSVKSTGKSTNPWSSTLLPLKSTSSHTQYFTYTHSAVGSKDTHGLGYICTQQKDVCMHACVCLCEDGEMRLSNPERTYIKPLVYIQFVSVFHSLLVCVEGSRSDQHKGRVTAAAYTNTTYRRVAWRKAVRDSSVTQVQNHHSNCSVTIFMHTSFGTFIIFHFARLLSALCG